MSQLLGSIEDAIHELDKYPNIKGIVNLESFKNQVSKKYPNGADLIEIERENKVSDFFIALLLARCPSFQQENTSAATPEGVLKNINKLIPELNLNNEAKESLGEKLINLKTSSLWDTLSEILIYKKLLSNYNHSSVGFEVTLGESKKKGEKSKNADFALFDESGKVSMFIDAFTPEKLSSCSEDINIKMVDWIARKYKKKFSTFCNSENQAKVAIIVSAIKNEEFFTFFIFNAMMNNNEPSPIQSEILDRKKGLLLGLVTTFRCSDRENLDVHIMAKYERHP